MSAAAEFFAKQAVRWFDNASDEEVLRVLAPGFIKLCSGLPLARKQRIVKLLQQALTSAAASVAVNEA